MFRIVKKKHNSDVLLSIHIISKHLGSVDSWLLKYGFEPDRTSNSDNAYCFNRPLWITFQINVESAGVFDDFKTSSLYVGTAAAAGCIQYG